MGSILILSDDKAVIHLVEKAVSGENHRITTMQTDEKTLDYSATMNPDLVFLGGCSDFMTPGLLDVGVARFRSRDIPILLFREPNARQKPAFSRGNRGRLPSLAGRSGGGSPADGAVAEGQAATRSVACTGGRRRTDRSQTTAAFSASNSRFAWVKRGGTKPGFVDPVRS